MSIIEAIILGIIQGISEFLPISSTGHLTIFGRMFNLISEENPQAWTSFIAVIQLGTLVAILVYFLAALGPAILAAVKYGWKALLVIIFSELFWFVIGLILYMIFFKTGLSSHYPTPIMY